MNEQSHVSPGFNTGASLQRQSDLQKRRSEQVQKEHAEFVKDFVAYFKKSAALDTEWHEKWLASVDSNSNDGRYSN